MRVTNWDEELVVEARRQFDDKRCRPKGGGNASPS